VRQVQPAHLVVLTSREGRRGVDDALRSAGATGVPCDVVELADPHNGFAELATLVTRDLRGRMVDAAAVIVNVTGGTTLMQCAAERLGAEARALGTATRRIALVDRRPYDEQRRDPYVLGECVWLDSEEGTAAAANIAVRPRPS